MIRSNLFQRLLLTEFLGDEPAFILAMKLIVVLYDNPITKVLLSDRGFDAALIRQILSSHCASKEAQDFANRLLNELPAHTILASLWNGIKDKVKTQGIEGIGTFGKDIFDSKFILTNNNRELIIKQIDEAIAKQQHRLVATEEECLFDYTEVNPDLHSDSAFTKIGRYISSRRLLPRNFVI